MNKPAIAAVILIFFGVIVFTYFDLYSLYAHTDKLFHIAGGFIAVWFLSEFWKGKLAAFSLFERVIMYVSLGLCVGFFWELLEFSTSQPPLANIHLIRHYLYGGDLMDTFGDLLADALGASLFGFLRR